jgi:quercetin 2,3-dioxygenase
VINKDIVQPGTGFGTHGHRIMGILTYVLSGTLHHRDRTGNSGDIRYGEVQLMSAGTGMRHSEINLSQNGAVHLLQIWIMPDRQGLTPGHRQKDFSLKDKLARWCLLAAPGTGNGSLLIHQNASVFASRLGTSESLDYPLAADRKAYLHVARGSVQVNGYALSAVDALMFSDEKQVQLEAANDAEVLLFDLG